MGDSAGGGAASWLKNNLETRLAGMGRPPMTTPRNIARALIAFCFSVNQQPLHAMNLDALSRYYGFRSAGRSSRRKVSRAAFGPAFQSLPERPPTATDGHDAGMLDGGGVKVALVELALARAC